jgi:rhodanese-related sulfurtransferase
MLNQIKLIKMNHSRLFYIPVLLTLLFIGSCSEDEQPINEALVLVEYLESADSPLGKDYVNSDLPSIITADEVKGLNATGDIYIIDIRSAADFAKGFIKNAVNVAEGQVLAHVEDTDLSDYQKIAVVCYSGQTAGWATCILRLAGYDNAFSMKWGMNAWNSDISSSWDDNIGNGYATHFTTEATEKGPAGSLPALSTGKTTGEEIFKARAAAVMAEGFTAAKVSAKAVTDNKDDYYIVNYWNTDDYNDPGHIEGAVQYTPGESMALAEDLKTLPTDKPIAVYCYTGQTSAFLTAYLRLLGYNAKSILYGTNGMIYDQCKDAGMTVWSDSEKKEYSVETGD